MTVVGCLRSGHRQEGGRPSTAEPGAPALSARTPASLGPGNHLRDVPGWPKRPYDLHLPPGYDPTRPIPVILAFHGGGGHSGHMARLSCPGGDPDSPGCLDRLADREGFAVVYPNGTAAVAMFNIRTFNAGGGDKGYGCVSRYACERRIDDVGYTRALLDDLERTAAVDPARVYATGMSNGAAMAHRLACQLSERIAAIAAVGGANQFAAAASCTPSRPVSVLQIHGTNDPAWPYEGGVPQRAEERGPMASVSGTMRGWAERNGCSLTPTVEPLPDTAADGTATARIAYPGCRAGTEVVLYRVDGGGHTWPQGWQYFAESRVGNTAQDFSANEVIWQFFARHPKP